MENPMGEVHVSRVEINGASAARVQIDRPTKLNALNSTLAEKLRDTFEDLAADEALHAVVLEGAGGKAWVVGADIAEMAVLDRQSAADFISRLHETMLAVRDFPVPVVAKLDGYALGAGMELAAACDLRVASTRALFGMPEVQVGLPSVIEASLLPRLMGAGRAGRLMLTGEMIDAQRAGEWGFVEEVVSPADLDTAVDAIVGDLCRAGRHALCAQKKLMRSWEAVSPDTAAAASISVFAGAFDTDEPVTRLGNFASGPSD